MTRFTFHYLRRRFFPSIHGLLKLCQRRGHRLDLDFVRSRDDEFCLRICPKSSKQQKNVGILRSFVLQKKWPPKKKAGKQKTTQTPQKSGNAVMFKKKVASWKKKLQGGGAVWSLLTFSTGFWPFRLSRFTARWWNSGVKIPFLCCK